MRVAAVQMTSTADKDANLDAASRLVTRAVDDGADLVVLPEMFNCLGSGAELRAAAEPLDGPTSAWAADQAKRHGISLVAGSFIERAPDGNTLHNTCGVYAPDGSRTAVYRKIHLFDVAVPGAEFRESDAITAGTDVVVTEIEDKAGPPLPLGLSICYDLRFPELYRIAALRGARAMTVPAAFTATTGPPHWETLLRARAIENQIFVIAAGQRGASSAKLRWHGHSMIVDPWGTVMVQASDTEAVIVADLDLAEQDRIRSVLPSLANRQPGTYAWPR